MNFRGKCHGRWDGCSPTGRSTSSGGAGRRGEARRQQAADSDVREPPQPVTLPEPLYADGDVRRRWPAETGDAQDRSCSAGSRPWGRRRHRSFSRPSLPSRLRQPAGASPRPRGDRVGPRPPPGSSVRYTIWRGPAAIQYEPMFAVPKDGKATTKMTFTEPGEYVLKARATDGALPARRKSRSRSPPQPRRSGRLSALARHWRRIALRASGIFLRGSSRSS